MTNARFEMARELFQNAYQLQMQGDFDLAAQFYKRSIELHPTAEAHTFLGWTYHYQGKIDEAIAECKKAIAVDPTFGNPYNDIGAYLIERGEHHHAIPRLEPGIASPRYGAVGSVRHASPARCGGRQGTRSRFGSAHSSRIA